MRRRRLRRRRRHPRRCRHPRSSSLQAPLGERTGEAREHRRGEAREHAEQETTISPVFVVVIFVVAPLRDGGRPPPPPHRPSALPPPPPPSPPRCDDDDCILPILPTTPPEHRGTHREQSQTRHLHHALPLPEDKVTAKRRTHYLQLGQSVVCHRIKIAIGRVRQCSLQSVQRRGDAGTNQCRIRRPFAELV